MNTDKRIKYIDFLKCIGLICIILAHVNPPECIMVVRSFDVPLMVMISGILSSISFKANQHSLRDYIWHRFKRLIVPTWLFLVLYFLIHIVFLHESFSIQYILYSFALTRYAVNYVWIILIYFYCALLIPLFLKIDLTWKSVFLILFIYFLYEIAFYYQVGTDNGLVLSTIYYLIPYGTITFFGYNYLKMKKARLYVCVLSFLIYLFLLILYCVRTGHFQPVASFKFPPRIYYISYGVFCSFVLLWLCQSFDMKFFSNSFVRFVSSHSMWIYLWHILWLEISETIGLASYCLLRLLFVFICSCVTVLFVNKILDILVKFHNLRMLNYFRG